MAKKQTPVRPRAPRTPLQRATSIVRAPQHMAEAVALALLMLSLGHLTEGLQAIGMNVVEAWLMAIGIDLAIIAGERLELGGRKSAWSRSAVYLGLAWSAALNGYAVWEHSQLLWLSVLCGLSIPMMIIILLGASKAPTEASVKAAATKERKRQAYLRGRFGAQIRAINQ